LLEDPSAYSEKKSPHWANIPELNPRKAIAMSKLNERIV
jgi:hypothetical protein